MPVALPINSRRVPLAAVRSLLPINAKAADPTPLELVSIAFKILVPLVPVVVILAPEPKLIPRCPPDTPVAWIFPPERAALVKRSIPICVPETPRKLRFAVAVVLPLIETPTTLPAVPLPAVISPVMASIEPPVLSTEIFAAVVVPPNRILP